jgi:membrane fusion protein (multidrug efflux system)
MKTASIPPPCATAFGRSGAGGSPMSFASHARDARATTAAPMAACLLAAAIGLGLASGCSKASNDKPKGSRDDAIPISVVRVEIVPLDRTLPVFGTLFAKDEATIGAQVEGQVEKTLVDFGDRLTAGQELALIDTASYQALARQAEANVARAKANALNAEQTLKRTAELQKHSISSAADFDLATAQAVQAQADVKAVEAANAIAQLNLERSRVRAAFDGAVAERIASAGDYLKVGAPLFRVVNDRVLKYIVQAPERYAAEVKKEQLVQFTVDAWPGETFEGKVYLISPSVNTATRAFNLGALVQNADQRLKASSFARGELVLQRGVPTPVVPLEAVVNFAGVTKVFVVSNSVVQGRDIKTGRIKDGRQEVLEGLKEGEVVATSGQAKLYTGAKVRVKDAAAKSENQVSMR